MSDTDRMKQLKERVAGATRSSLSPVKLGEWELLPYEREYGYNGTVLDENGLFHLKGKKKIALTYHLYQQLPQYRTIKYVNSGGDLSNPEIYHLPFPYLVYLVEERETTYDDRDPKKHDKQKYSLKLRAYISETPITLSNIDKNLVPLEWLPNISDDGSVCLGTKFSHGPRATPEQVISTFWNSMFDEHEDTFSRPKEIKYLYNWEKIDIKYIMELTKIESDSTNKGRPIYDHGWEAALPSPLRDFIKIKLVTSPV